MNFQPIFTEVVYLKSEGRENMMEIEGYVSGIFGNIVSGSQHCIHIISSNQFFIQDSPVLRHGECEDRSSWLCARRIYFP